MSQLQVKLSKSFVVKLSIVIVIASFNTGLYMDV